MIIFRRFVDSAERNSENCGEMCAINFQCDNDLIELCMNFDATTSE